MDYTHAFVGCSELMSHAYDAIFMQSLKSSDLPFKVIKTQPKQNLSVDNLLKNTDHLNCLTCQTELKSIYGFHMLQIV